MIKLSPSLLAANPLCLGEEAKTVSDCGCDELHFDVMDSHFVPNLTFGPHILKAIRPVCPIVMDVHLMLSKPYGMLEPFANAGADVITVHAEAEAAAACLQKIRAMGKKAGLSLKPKTDVADVAALLPLCDRVLLMTVEPGFGGQKLMPEVLSKAKVLRGAGFDGDIEADGGITCENASVLAAAGVQTLVMGTAFFGSANRLAVVQAVHAL